MRENSGLTCHACLMPIFSICCEIPWDHKDFRKQHKIQISKRKLYKRPRKKQSLKTQICARILSEQQEFTAKWVEPISHTKTKKNILERES